MILTKELEWKPSAEQMAWVKTMLNVANNHALMFTPEGTYVFDHDKKTITLFWKSPSFSSIKHEKIRRTFLLLGYDLLDATGVKSA